MTAFEDPTTSSAEVAARLTSRVQMLGRGAWIAHLPAFLEDTCMPALRDELPLQQEFLVICGRRIATPRLTSWHGEPHARYRYSGRTFEPRPWTPTLVHIRERLAETLGVGFDGVLANWYRDGSDAMGWHSDDEAELGPAAPHDVLVASVSLGAMRSFVLRDKQGNERLEMALGGGDLFVMGGSTQRFYRHSVPRERGVTTPRLNLTFRLFRRAAA